MTEQEPAAWRYKYRLDSGGSGWSFEIIPGKQIIESQALYTSPQSREWQPIETAPIEPFNKDHWYKAHSKPLLLSDARYNSVYIGSYNFTQKGKGRFLDVMGYVKQPTHWMPLPPPPKE